MNQVNVWKCHQPECMWAFLGGQHILAEEISQSQTAGFRELFTWPLVLVCDSWQRIHLYWIADKWKLAPSRMFPLLRQDLTQTVNNHLKLNDFQPDFLNLVSLIGIRDWMEEFAQRDYFSAGEPWFGFHVYQGAQQIVYFCMCPCQRLTTWCHHIGSSNYVATILCCNKVKPMILLNRSL